MNEWLFRLITMILSLISPELRQGLTDWVIKLEADAKETSNPWDDIFVGLLKSVLGIK